MVFFVGIIVLTLIATLDAAVAYPPALKILFVVIGIAECVNLILKYFFSSASFPSNKLFCYSREVCLDCASACISGAFDLLVYFVRYLYLMVVHKRRWV